MRYLDLIADNPLIWGLFLCYMAGTAALAWRGHKKTHDMASFAIGRGDMSPVVVGITLAASIASAATFVINPGFVYVHGVSALMHLGVAVLVGIVVGLVLMSAGFRKIGAASGALTLPQWIGERYGSKLMRLFFALTNLLSLSFVVLIVGGLSIVMQKTLGLTNIESLVLIVGFVFSYVFVGGTYAHAYTNTLQGAIMVVIAAIIVSSGFGLLADGVGPFIEAIGVGQPEGEHLVALTNPTSKLFGSFFTVFVCGFVVGFALVCQPHIMTKALYVKDDKAVRKYLIVTIAVFSLFTMLLFVGLYARVAGMDPTAFLDPATGKFRQDMVMTVYIVQTFPGPLVAVITVALLAAGMSTLDGILVALSSIAANDIFLPLTRGNLLKDKDAEAQSRAAHRASQVFLVLMGIAAFFIALDPPKLLGIFGQVGVYGIVAASTAPILFGILVPTASGRLMFAAAIAGLGTHFSLYAWGQWAVANKLDLATIVSEWGPVSWFFDTSAVQLGLLNPGVGATYGIILSALVASPAALSHLLAQKRYSNPMSNPSGKSSGGLLSGNTKKEKLPEAVM